MSTVTEATVDAEEVRSAAVAEPKCFPQKMAFRHEHNFLPNPPEGRLCRPRIPHRDRVELAPDLRALVCHGMVDDDYLSSGKFLPERRAHGCPQAKRPIESVVGTRVGSTGGAGFDTSGAHTSYSLSLFENQKRL